MHKCWVQERAEQREAALSKAEKSLDEDTARFDNFLKENADKLAEAMVKAEHEARAKQEQVIGKCHMR